MCPAQLHRTSLPQCRRSSPEIRKTNRRGHTDVILGHVYKWTLLRPTASPTLNKIDDVTRSDFVEVNGNQPVPIKYRTWVSISVDTALSRHLSENAMRSVGLPSMTCSTLWSQPREATRTRQHFSPAVCIQWRSWLARKLEIDLHWSHTLKLEIAPNLINPEFIKLQCNSRI